MRNPLRKRWAVVAKTERREETGFRYWTEKQAHAQAAHLTIWQSCHWTEAMERLIGEPFGFEAERLP